MAERTNEKGLTRGTSTAAAHTARARRALCPRGPVPPVVLPAQRTLRVTKEQIWEVGEGNPGPPSPLASTWGVGDAARSVPQLLPECRPHPWPLRPLRSWPLPRCLPWSVLCCSVSWGTWGVKATPAPSRSLEAPGGGVQGAQVPDVVSATGKGPVNAKRKYPLGFSPGKKGLSNPGGLGVTQHDYLRRKVAWGVHTDPCFLNFFDSRTSLRIE